MVKQNTLSRKNCTPCEGIGCVLSSKESKALLKKTPGWSLSKERPVISRTYILKNFMAAVTLIERIADVAEQQDHHPDIHLEDYRNLRVDLTTHALKGLSENDFILAAKINRLKTKLKQ